jgi:hypothetical protein
MRIEEKSSQRLAQPGPTRYSDNNVIGYFPILFFAKDKGAFSTIGETAQVFTASG